MNPSPKSILKIMPDYFCWPLWRSENGMYDNLHPEELGFPSHLCEALMQWSEEFDAILNQDDPAQSAFPNPEAKNAFVETGMRLAREVKALVQDRHVVLYFDLLQNRAFEVHVEQP